MSRQGDFNLDLEKGGFSHSNSNSTEYDPQPIQNSNVLEVESTKDNGADDASSIPMKEFSHSLAQVTTSQDGDLIHLGNQTFHKADLRNAFAGDLNPGLHTTPHRPMGNPVPLGLSGFCICCFVAAMVFLQARSVTHVNIIAGEALFFGGIVETVAGLWCLVVENTFAATALGSFGGFWFGYGTILIDGFGIVSSYSTTRELNNALGFYITPWVIFAFLMWICTFKSTWPFFILFTFVWTFLMLLAIGYFIDSTGVLKAGGAIALLATFTGFFIIFAGVANNENSYITIRPSPMPGAPTV